MRKEGVWFLSIVVLLFIGSMVVVDARLKQQAANLESPAAGALQQTIERLYELRWEIACKPGTDVAVLGEVLADTSDYRLTEKDRAWIEAVYGKDAVQKAGYRTAQQAYSLFWRNGLSLPGQGVPTPKSGPTLIPTAAPFIYCPESHEPVSVTINQISLLSDTRAVARYEYLENIYEAVLRKIDGRWMITSIRMVYYHGAG